MCRHQTTIFSKPDRHCFTVKDAHSRQMEFCCSFKVHYTVQRKKLVYVLKRHDLFLFCPCCRMFATVEGPIRPSALALAAATFLDIVGFARLPRNLNNYTPYTSLLARSWASLAVTKELVFFFFLEFWCSTKIRPYPKTS